jgi:hypothetical protein
MASSSGSAVPASCGRITFWDPSEHAMVNTSLDAQPHHRITVFTMVAMCHCRRENALG